MPLARLSTDSDTYSQQAAQSIRQAIREGRLSAGELYSVAMLAEEFGVSRTPVREALLVLERQGMVRFERNRGVRVLETTVHDLDEIFALRLLLEVPSAELACQRLDDAGRAALHGALEAMAQAAAVGDEPDFMARDRDFHEVIMAAAGNARLTAIIGDLRDHVRASGPSTVGRSRDLQDVLAEHEVIMAALDRRDPAASREAMRSHIANTGLLLVEQLGGSPADIAWADPAATSRP